MGVAGKEAKGVNLRLYRQDSVVEQRMQAPEDANAALANAEARVPCVRVCVHVYPFVVKFESALVRQQRRNGRTSRGRRPPSMGRICEAPFVANS